MSTTEPVSTEESHDLSMAASLRRRFLTALGVQIVLGFAIASLVLPPDPYSQVLSALGILAVAIPVSYWLVYGTELLA